MAYLNDKGTIKYLETVGELLAELRNPGRVCVTVAINSDDVMLVDAIKKDVMLALSVRDKGTPVDAYVHFPTSTVFIN